MHKTILLESLVYSQLHIKIAVFSKDIFLFGGFIQIEATTGRFSLTQFTILR